MKRQKVGWKYALGVFGVALLAMLVMDFNGRMAELRRLTEDRESVSAKATSLAQTQSALSTQVVYATSDAAVMKWAYEDGHMVRPGDNPVVPLAPANTTPAPTPTPVVTQVEVSNWEAWLALFLGPRTRD